MVLREYQRRRDFSKTAEPAPASAAPARPETDAMFVIQKHDARRLHYDFRLEIDGVLASWAVPKGIPFEQGDKRLAMHVEDHPLDYATFEGIIPEGQYGGGTVMVWDHGTYEVSGNNPHAALHEGKLHLCLHGKKLQGEWTLVRMRHGTGHKDEWLLMKTGDSIRPLSQKRDNESALTGRTMKQIAAARDAEWNSNRTESEEPAVASPSRRAAAPRTRLKASARTVSKPHPRPATATRSDPHSSGAVAGGKRRSGAATAKPVSPPRDAPRSPPAFVSPMKPKLVGAPPQGEGWIYELKFDGYRTIAMKDVNSVDLISRNEKRLRFPDLAEAVAALPCQSAVLDGEITALDDQGRPSFQLLQARELGEPAPICLYLFDLLNLDGRDLKGFPLTERKTLLQSLLAEVPDPLRFSASFTGDPAALLDEIKSRGLEGMIAKRANSRYEPGLRSGSWVKLKCTGEQEFVIGGYTPPQGSRSYFGSVLVGYHDGDMLRFAGKVGTGFSEKQLSALYKRLQELRAPDCPFADLPSKSAGRWNQGITPTQMKKCTWTRPELVCQVKFSEWTRDGKLRQPVFLGLREDKAAAEVVREG